MAKNSTDEPDSQGPSTEDAAMDMAADTANNISGCQKAGSSADYCNKLYTRGYDMKQHGEGQPLKPVR